jgi:putative ABC transport system permease protein
MLLIGRLVGRDLRYRPSQAVLLLVAICAATSVLSLALALHGVTSKPYQQTRAATRGPDVVAAFGPPASAGPHGPGPGAAQAAVLRSEKALMNAPGVTGHSGPYPVASVIVRLGKVAAPMEAEGRSEAAASLDQPKLIAGSWVRPEGIVLERTFAEAIGASVGDRVSLDNRTYTVAGIAVTAASAPYPNLCFPPGGDCVFDLPMTCNGTACSAAGISGIPENASYGLGWVTEPDARALASASAPLTYLLNLKLKDPATAQAFATTHSNPNLGPGSGGLVSWQSIAYNDGLLVQDEQQVLTPGAWLAGLLAIACVAVLAGGRMADQNRRVGLLKAVGGTPGLVGVVLMAENLALAVLAAGIGLLAGWLAAPLITSPGAALVGAPGATRSQLTGAIAVAQLMPAIPGAILGVPLGLGLFVAASGAGTTGTTIPSAGWLVSAVLGTLVVVTGLTTIPAGAGARRPVTDVLAQEA